MFDWLEDLNPAQREAVLHRGSHLLIVAGAGSGKTRTLACRVAHLIGSGVRPERILLLTFSRRAAREMLARAGQLVETAGTGRVWGGTFHAVANRVLRLHGRAVGLRPGFTVLDQGDATDLFGLVRHDLGLGEQGRRFPKKDTLASIYSRVVNAQERLPEVVERDYPWCRGDVDGIKQTFAAYVERKHAHNVVDYDDLLLYWRALLAGPGVGAILRGAFDHILVDEFQDTNAVQADIVAAMAGPGVTVAAVGDDAQAIYGFRSGSAVHMLEFPQRFAGAAVITLDRNYRSTPDILEAANAVMADAAEGFAKQLWSTRSAGLRPRLVTCVDELAQSAFVCDNILEFREQGIPLHAQAVLFRTGHHSDGLEVELARRNVPFVKYGGLKFLESAHIKDVMSLLRIVENPTDELAWHRVLGLLSGVGPATVRRLMDELAVADARALTRLLGDDCPRFPPAALAELDALRTALRDLAGGELSPAVEIERLTTACAAIFARKYPENSAARIADLEHLRSMAAAYQQRNRFLAELTLDPPSSTSDLAGPPHLDDDHLILSTIHSAKGGEWRIVHLIHASDGNIPSDMSLGSAAELEEERRLLYVALTRAQDALIVTYPTRYYFRGNPLDDAHAYSQPSRFLSGLTAFDRASVGEDVVEDDPVRHELAALWD